jgi:ribonuclease P protein subunit POP4
LIGLYVEVDENMNRSMVGTKGRIVDEMRKMITILDEEGEKKIPKSQSIFIFTLPDGTRTRIEGSRLVARPEDRIKKRL